jgi:hypothetical protein
MIGSALWFTLCAVCGYRFHRLLACACPAPQHVCAQVNQLAGDLGLVRSPSAWLVPGRISPLLWVFGGRARLLVPAALWDRLDAEQQRTLLVHELAHLRRGDQWVRCLEILVTGLYWWHPVVWWARREIREAEEQCCDAWVVWALPRAARAYATALVETVDFLSETRTALPVAASGIGQVHDLRRRITMIMRGTTPRALSAAGFLAVVGLGVLLLPLLPSWAQQIPYERQDEQGRQVGRSREDDRQREQGSRRDAQARREGDDQLQKQRQMVERFAQEVQAQQQRLQELMGQLQNAQEGLRKIEQETQLRLTEERRRRYDVALAGQEPRAGSRREAPRDLENRLAEVERKLDILLAEVQGLRRELRRGHEGSSPEARPHPPEHRRPGAGPGAPAGAAPVPGRAPIAVPPPAAQPAGQAAPNPFLPGETTPAPETPSLPPAPGQSAETPPGAPLPPLPTQALPPVSSPERSPTPSRR